MVLVSTTVKMDLLEFSSHLGLKQKFSINWERKKYFPQADAFNIEKSEFY